MPPSVIERAGEVLAKLEKYEFAVFADEDRKGLAKAAHRQAASQISLFALANEAAIDELRDVTVDSLSPEESKNLLISIRSRIV